MGLKIDRAEPEACGYTSPQPHVSKLSAITKWSYLSGWPAWSVEWNPHLRGTRFGKDL